MRGKLPIELLLCTSFLLVISKHGNWCWRLFSLDGLFISLFMILYRLSVFLLKLHISGYRFFDVVVNQLAESAFSYKHGMVVCLLRVLPVSQSLFSFGEVWALSCFFSNHNILVFFTSSFIEPYHGAIYELNILFTFKWF